ncbi:uncharacterized protein Z518_06595 [Rhinocladiella mackenziei CBS 650.93]|uniref:Rhinocladiella mackenziei CBS 650.93 unplaced genomic scaffold supercont1.5, whole genome shotgun sequence n=1 Tax=Rhinocladiella mackenziei CBS 650.93 TaxID=1442369 RepID=A0A0D2J2C6_9EURO|nr:uncharacterized protein Z518_06595 [Rhinocladiella mackenziei CBS 650.93]KIX03045.1 hypothetical protein Z518_06595 [Rhinocladiella mackenziei CBS 650.93]
MKQRRLQPEDYRIGWICALPIELQAASEMLDEEHHDLPRDANHPNIYTLGRVNHHNIVIVCLPAGQIGPSSAATVVGQMKSKFPLMEHMLMFNMTSAIPSQFSSLRDKAGSDFLFESTYEHTGGTACDVCSGDRLVFRRERENEDVVVHYGTIGSGSQVIRDGVTRDKLSSEPGGVLCFEMEAAGVMSRFPCLVIRGICDYADSHKNKTWQPYAAATAAAFAKVLLSVIPAADVRRLNYGPESDWDKLLPIASEATFNSYEKRHHSFCLPDTRVAVLDEIYAWADGDSEQRIFWLNGMAGTGKSTIARTVARKCYEVKRLGGSFFFSRSVGDVSHTGKFCTTIAWQLANAFPALHTLIHAAIMENRDIANQTLRDQWYQLILQPLSNFSKNTSQPSLIIAIDALDECDGASDVRLLLRLIAEANGIMKFRIFITSRPDTPIRLGFRALPGILYHDLILHDISRAIVDHDIRMFLDAQFKAIREDSEYPLADWPEKGTVDILVQKGGGLFIYAATICRFITTNEKWPPRRLLEIFLTPLRPDLSRANVRQIPLASPTSELDAMYTQILMNSFMGVTQDEEELSLEFKQIVGSIVLLSEPLSPAALGTLLDIDEETVYVRLRDLRSVIRVQDDRNSPVRLLHPSFRDFLLDNGRCKDPLFQVDERKGHQFLARCCLNQLSSPAGLKRDICGLEWPGTLIEDVDRSEVAGKLPTELQYACRYWVQHLQHGEQPLDDNGGVYAFLQQHLLHWLESLGLIGNLSDSVKMVIALQSMVALIHDARRFILYNRPIIEKAPLQLYSGALVFAPQTSVIRRQFLDQAFQCIHHLPEVEEYWCSAIMTLEGYTTTIWSLVFSPDSQLLASTSANNIVKLSHTATGALSMTFEGHSDWVFAMTFSPDGKLLASASDDGTVKLWDVEIGELHKTLSEATYCSPLKAPVTRGSASVAFSPDGQLFASAAPDRTIRLWNPRTGLLLSTFTGICPIVFSPDSQLLTSVPADKVVSLRNASTGVLSLTLEGHLNWVVAVAFSPDGRLFASASCDTTIKLWNLAVGACCNTLQGHSDWGPTVSFLQDGQLLASTTPSGTVELWDVKTGELRRTLKARHVTFSPNGQLLACTPYDFMKGGSTIQLWDIETGELRETLKGHSCSVGPLAFSPNGQLLASGSEDETVRLWDLRTRTLQGHQHHSARVSAVAFSLDGKLLVSASLDGTVKLWDSGTGVLIDTFKGHSKSVFDIAFSSTGELLATASSDNSVILWNLKLRMLIHTLLGHSSSVFDVAFSSDCRLLASASDDKTVRLWDVENGVPYDSPYHHPGQVTTVAFSPNGQLLASVSAGTGPPTVRIWDLSSRSVLGTFTERTRAIWAMAFSPNGELLVSTSYNKEVMLWPIRSGRMIKRIFVGCEIRELSFSSDGSLINTDRGALELRSLQHSNDEPFSIQSCLYIKDRWIALGTKNVLWLPHDYRAARSAVQSDTVVLRHASGRFSLVKFDLDAIVRMDLASQESRVFKHRLAKRKMASKESELYVDGIYIPCKKMNKETARHDSPPQERYGQSQRIPPTTIQHPSLFASSLEIIPRFGRTDFLGMLDQGCDTSAYTVGECYQTWHKQNLKELQRWECNPVFKCDGSSWRITFYPFGYHKDHMSLHPQLVDDRMEPENSYVCVQFALILWSPSQSFKFAPPVANHRFNICEEDWGLLFQQHPWEDLQDSPGVENEEVNITAHVRVVKDPRCVLRPSTQTYNSKKETGMVGLINQGATGSINTILQSLYFINAFRKAVYQIPTEKTATADIAWALQRLFLSLQTSNTPVSTRELTNSFCWDWKECFKQRDAFNLLNELIARLEKRIKGTPVEDAPSDLFFGKQKTYIRCVHVELESSRLEQFFSLGLHVGGCRSLDASFREFIKIEWVHKYYTGQRYGFQDATKGIVFEMLPPVLFLRLNRFRYDVDRDALTILHDYYEFPEEFDAAPYLSARARDFGPWTYLLVSVIVREGDDIDDGYYYAFLRPTKDGSFYKFYNDRVTPAALKDVTEANFGGNQNKRHVSPAILIYIRKSRLDDVFDGAAKHNASDQDCGIV